MISALVTKDTNLEEKLLQTKHQANATDKTEIPTGGKPKLMIPEWRTRNEGIQCDHDGKSWYWCPYHKKPGLFDGLYMPHKPEDHDEWRAKKYPYKKP